MYLRIHLGTKTFDLVIASDITSAFSTYTSEAALLYVNLSQVLMDPVQRLRVPSYLHAKRKICYDNQPI